MSAARAIARSRLVHFLVVGGVLWALAPAEKDATVHVRRDAVTKAVAEAQARTGRPLAPEEEKRVVAEFVAERVLAAEGRRLGLAEDDDLVRARVAEKMRAALESTAPEVPVTEDEIRTEAAALAAEAASRIELDLAFVSKERGAAAESLARALTTGDPNAARDKAPVPAHATWTEAELARTVGANVALFVRTAPEGTWSPPLATTWGFYVARVVARRPATSEEMRAEARLAVQRKKRAAAVATMVERAARKYRFEVEGTSFAPADLAPKREAEGVR